MSTIYRPLNEEQGEIRLLLLRPSASFDDRIECSLFHAFLDRLPEYEALSYVWGPLVFSQEISLDGKPFKITENLECALRYLRHASIERVLWVDALCINQECIPERNHQVTLMKDVYSLCVRDLAWLGPNPGTARDEDNTRQSPIDDGDRSNLELLQDGMRIFRKIHQHDAETLDSMLALWREYKGLSEPGYDDEGNPPGWIFSYKDQMTLRWLFRTAPLWSRIWVMQELSCARRVLLVAGRDTLDWNDVASFLGDDNKPYADAFHVTGGHYTLNGVVVMLFGRVQTIDQQRRIVRDVQEEKYKSTLMDVLARFQYADARDPRDVIYGLLGLVSEAHPIKVDYSKPVQELFADITKFLIDRSGNLDIICQNPWSIGKRPGKEDLKSLPSWAVNFIHRRRFEHFENGLGVLLFAQRGIFSAGSVTCSTPCKLVQGNLLVVDGVILDELGVVQYDESDKLVNMDKARNWMHCNFGQQPLLVGGSATYPPTGEPYFRAYWRTLVMDCKAYPIVRLSPDDVEADEKVFSKIMWSETRERSMEAKLSCNDMLQRVLYDWTFTMSKRGLLLMVIGDAQEGDVLAVLDGGKVPCLLRPLPDKEQMRYRVVHSVYIHGYMDGQVAGEVEQGRLKRQQLLLT